MVLRAFLWELSNQKTRGVCTEVLSLEKEPRTTKVLYLLYFHKFCIGRKRN